MLFFLERIDRLRRICVSDPNEATTISPPTQPAGEGDFFDDGMKCCFSLFSDDSNWFDVGTTIERLCFVRQWLVLSDRIEKDFLFWSNTQINSWLWPDLTNSPHLILGLSFNQPKLCPDATWYANGITFANDSIVGVQPLALFVNTNNTVFVARQDTGQILIWRNASVNAITTIFANLSYPQSMFVINAEQILVDNGNGNSQVDRWISNGTRLSSSMSLCSTRCLGLFVDVMSNLYCTQNAKHQVVRRSLVLTSGTMTIVAGTGCPGSTADMLHDPNGIFVTTNLDLYVADCYNDRIQLFRLGQMIGTTVVGNGSNQTIQLRYPTGIVLDADGYLFIVDNNNHRIVGSGPGGFRCVVGCFGSGASPNQLSYPRKMSFDREGNIFVADQYNDRIQKFLLSNNSCGKTSRVERLAVSPSFSHRFYDGVFDSLNRKWNR